MGRVLSLLDGKKYDAVLPDDFVYSAKANRRRKYGHSIRRMYIMPTTQPGTLPGVEYYTTWQDASSLVRMILFRILCFNRMHSVPLKKRQNSFSKSSINCLELRWFSDPTS